MPDPFSTATATAKPTYSSLAVTRPRRVSAATPFARKEVKAAVPFAIFALIGPWLIKIIEAILKASDQAESGEMPGPDDKS